MAKFTRIDVVLAMGKVGIIPVFYHPETEVCINVLKACHEGGANVFEFTNRGDGAHEIFAETLKYARKELPGMILGAGSIVDAGTASLYIQLGADFIVSPILNPEVGRVCNRRKIGWMPGCGTVSEISQAEELGAEVVKIFPGEQVGGPAFVKGVKGPMPWTSIMPTGGVSPTRENLSSWIGAGVHCVGMGSKLITKDVIVKEDYAGLTETVRNAVALFSEIRNGSK